MVNHSRYMEKLAQWTVIALPALAMWVPVGAEAWLLLVLLAMALAWLTGWRPKAGIWGKEQKTIAWALVAMVSIKALSLLWSIAPALTLHHVKLHLHLLLYVPLLVLFGQTKEVEKTFFNKAIPFAIFPGALWAVWAWVQKGYPLGGFEFEGATKNSLILSLLLTYVGCNLLFALMKASSLYRWALLAMVLFIMMANGKRSTGLVIIVTFAVAWFFDRKDQLTTQSKTGKNPKTFGMLFLGVLLMIILIGLTWSKWMLAWQQTQQFFGAGYAGGSIDTRFELYRLAINAFTQKMFFGYGAGSAKAVIAQTSELAGLAHYNHYHQLILQWLADLGIVGFSVFAGALVAIQRSLNKVSIHSSRLKLSAYTTVLIMVLFGITNLSFGNILAHIMFVYMLAVIGVSAYSGSAYLTPTTPTP